MCILYDVLIHTRLDQNALFYVITQSAIKRICRSLVADRKRGFFYPEVCERRPELRGGRTRGASHRVDDVHRRMLGMLPRIRIHVEKN